MDDTYQIWKQGVCEIIKCKENLRVRKEYTYINQYPYTTLTYQTGTNNRVYETIKHCKYPLLTYNKTNDTLINTYYQKAAEYFGSFEIRKTIINWYQESNIIKCLRFRFKYEDRDKYFIEPETCADFCKKKIKS